MTPVLIFAIVLIIAALAGIGHYLRTSSSKPTSLFGDLSQESTPQPPDRLKQRVVVTNPIRAALVGSQCVKGIQCCQRLTAPLAKAIDSDKIDDLFLKQWGATLDESSAVTFALGLKRMLEHYASAELVDKDEFSQLIKRSLVGSLAKLPCQLCLLFSRWAAGNEGKLAIRWSTGVTDVFVFDPKKGTVTFKVTSGNEQSRVEKFKQAFGVTTLHLK